MPADELQSRLNALWKEAGEIWDRSENEASFRRFVSTDYQAVYATMRELQDEVHTFLEWGSGTGVVTIMAGMLGWAAYGIEIEPDLVERSRRLAEGYCCDVEFGTGNFIPESYIATDEWQGKLREDESGYSALELQLNEFDLVYAYPWPDEIALFDDIMRHCGRGVRFLTYDDKNGIRLQQF